MELLETIWRDDFFSLLAAVVLGVLMVMGFWSYMVGTDRWTGVGLLVLGSLLFLVPVYAKYVVATDPNASIMMHFFAHVRKDIIYAGFIGGSAVGWLAGSALVLWKRYRE